MKIKDSLNILSNATVYFFAIIFVIAIVIGCVRHCNKPIESLPSPVERNETIDSLTTTNKIILIEINNLDSIKDAEIIEVKNLDNDSTLKLFYELIRR